MDLKRRFPRYSRLLRLYPLPYRQEYGPEILQTLADMLDGAESSSQRTAIWLRATIDLPLSATKQQLILVGGIMAHETPDYLKRSATIGAILVSPFLTFLFLDSITSHSLYGGFFWRPWVVATWIVFMPAAALLVTSAAFVRWSVERQRRGRVSFWRSLLDWRHNWPVVGIAALSLGIILLALFHDSVHCVVHNPIPEIRYWHTTWTCIRNG